MEKQSGSTDIVARYDCGRFKTFNGRGLQEIPVLAGFPIHDYYSRRCSRQASVVPNFQRGDKEPFPAISDVDQRTWIQRERDLEKDGHFHPKVKL